MADVEPESERVAFGKWLADFRGGSDPKAIGQSAQSRSLKQADVLRAMNDLPDLGDGEKKSRSYLARVESGKMVPSRDACMQIGKALNSLGVVRVTGEDIWRRAAPLAASDPVRWFYEAQIEALKAQLTKQQDVDMHSLSAAEWDMLAALRKLRDDVDLKPEWLPGGERPRSHIRSTRPAVPPWMLGDVPADDVAAFVVHHLADELRNSGAGREQLLRRLVEITTTEARHDELVAWLELAVAAWDAASPKNALDWRFDFLQEQHLQLVFLALKRGQRAVPDRLTEHLRQQGPRGESRLIGDKLLEALVAGWTDGSAVGEE